VNSRELLELFQGGQSEAATAIFDRYVARLIALVRNRIGKNLRRRIDAEDVVQSAYRSFFVHAKNDEYLLEQSGDLWRLLARITLNKLYGQIEKQTAAMRDVTCEAGFEYSAESTEAPEPSVVEAVALGEELHSICKALTSDENLAITLRLQGRAPAEIGRILKKSERTVRRLLAAVEKKFEQRLLGEVSAKSIQGATTDPAAPLQYSNYVLEKLLGTGGMGKVFLARHLHTDKRVAIKALHKARQFDERAVHQFVQESQTLANLRHPNIVGVEGLGRFPSGGYFIVMDYVDRTDLRGRINHGPLTIEVATDIMAQVVQAIGYAHEHGIVHCDLKPENILLSRAGHVVVTDFGFACLVGAATTDAISRIGGTIGYIAPEVLRFQCPPTPAADIYAIGVLLCLLVGGKLPTVGPKVDNLGDEFAAAAAIARRCLADHPEDRFQSARELQEAIDSLRS
jgi:RNA polymerase sigma factor (sigma-70 family)